MYIFQSTYFVWAFADGDDVGGDDVDELYYDDGDDRYKNDNHNVGDRFEQKHKS